MVISVAFAVLCIVVSILFLWLDELPETLREMFSKRPSSDPRNLVPYRRPDDPDEDF